jgi:predicted nicotinamide N-methyase
MPYWAELWPSGVALARVVGEFDLAGKRVLELGAGLGLPSLAAVLRGADVLATDWAEEAVALLRENAARNGIALRAERVRWDDPGLLLDEGPWDLVLGADLLYEERNATVLLELLPLLGGDVLIAEPGRPAAAAFLARWSVEEVSDRVYRLG